MKNQDLKLKQVKQILNNPLLNDDTRIRFIRAVIANDYGKLSKSEADRLMEVSRRFAFSYSTSCSRPGADPFDKRDRSLLDRGLLNYRLAGATKKNDGLFTRRDLYITAVGKRALAARIAA